MGQKFPGQWWLSVESSHFKLACRKLLQDHSFKKDIISCIALRQNTRFCSYKVRSSIYWSLVVVSDIGNCATMENRIEIFSHNKHFSGKNASEVYQEWGRTPKIVILKKMTWTILRHHPWFCSDKEISSIFWSLRGILDKGKQQREFYTGDIVVVKNKVKYIRK